MRKNLKLPNGNFLRIERLYAFVAVGERGEGVMGMLTSSGWIPLVGADLERVESLRKYADASGHPYEIRLFEAVQS